VELVKIVDPAASAQEHLAMVADVETLLQSLELPFRTVKLCSADTGFSARLCFDIEVWMPGQQEYREVSSISNCFDFQAQRMNLRFRSGATDSTASPSSSNSSNKKKAKQPTRFPHTLNGSGVAIGR
jgi:seryl-tRNA synthetase